MTITTAKGLEGIIANSTAISDVLGEKGILIYAGYDINELAGRVSYEEVIYLLWHGRLPNQAELDHLKADLIHCRRLPEGVLSFITGAPKDANPMDILRTGISMMGLYDRVKESGIGADRKRAIDITAAVAIIAAYFHRARQGKSLPPIREDLGEAAHFLYLLNAEEPSAEVANTLDLAYVLHADHGMNASTFSARVTISTLSDMYSAITSAIGTLKGPLHGGANEGVIHMLLEIESLDRVDDWVGERLAQRKRIMGIGHRVYRTLDPRAPHLRRMALKLCNRIGEQKWIQMSERIAAIMKAKKGLHANVDFYSATVYHSLGIPTDMFTPIFTIARTAGWTAHILEQLADNRLYRPLSEYTGPVPGKRVKPINQR